MQKHWSRFQTRKEAIAHNRIKKIGALKVHRKRR